MPISSNLSLWLYPAAIQTTPPQGLRNYRPVCTRLEFTTSAPGGFGTLSATLNLSAKYFSRPELQLFAKVALMARGEPVFLGEIAEISISGAEEGEAISITCLGVGNCLRDDPSNFSYVNKTAQQIATDQFTVSSSVRAGYNFPISFDTSQVFPDNPATVYDNISYSWRTMEEIFNDLCTLAGGYVWTVYEHPTARDAAGFPVGRVNIHIRDATTTNYIASIDRRDVIQYEIAKSSDRAYNVVYIGYNTPSAGAPSYVHADDSRLTGAGGIGTADFRRRSYTREMAGSATPNSTNAQTMANTLLNQYKTGGNKVSLTLRAVRDQNDAPTPLYAVRADSNIWVRDIAGRGAQAPIRTTAGVNQFYIIQTTYREDESGATLQLTCDNYVNSIDVIVARIQYALERQARTGGKVTENVQALGAPIKGWCNVHFQASGASQSFSLQGTSFRPILSQAPTSISFAAPTVQTNCGSANYTNLSQYGFSAFVQSSGSGAGTYQGSFTTVGNCCYDVDTKKGTLTHHCDQCGTTRTGLRMKTDVIVVYDPSGLPSMKIECPCGAVEGFNLDLTGDDEVEGHNNPDHRAEQARNIRAIMRHAHVGLRAHVK